MGFLTESKTQGRTPVQIVELDFDSCSLTYGTSPCTASIGMTGADKCYNTFGTCQDTLNYAKTTKIYRFISQSSFIPVGENIIPCVKDVSFAPTKIVFGKGLGYRSSCTVILQDFKHNDKGVDPYITDRTYDVTQGTYFGKLLARNKYYNGRILRIRTGYMGNGYDVNNFETREYIIESIDGPDAKGQIKIVGKDILKKIENDRVKVPEVSEGELSADITDIDTSLTLIPIGIGSTYPSSGIIKIDKEIITYSSRSGDTLNGLARGQYLTTADSHQMNDGVQICKLYDYVNIVDIIYDILVNYAGIDASYIPYNDDPLNPDEWDDSKGVWLATKNYTTLISTPTGAQTLIDELAEQGLLVMWWDEATQKIKMKPIAPPTFFDTIPLVDDKTSIIMESSKLNNKDAERNSQVWAYYSPSTWAETSKEEDYKRVYITADLQKESANEYNDSRKKVIVSRWFQTENEARVFTNRYLGGTKDLLKEIRFRADAKDASLNIGDYINVSTRTRQDVTGASEMVQYCIIEKKWTGAGHQLEYLACQSWFQYHKYIYIAANGTPDYTSASETEKERYSFISFDANNITNGTFATDLTGWTASALCTGTWNASGYAEVTRTSAGAGRLFYAPVDLSARYQWKIYVDILNNPAGNLNISLYDASLKLLKTLDYGTIIVSNKYRVFTITETAAYISIEPDTVSDTINIDNVRIVNASEPVSTGLSNLDVPYLII